MSAVPVLKANRESVSGQPPAGYSYVKLTRQELKRFVDDERLFRHSNQKHDNAPKRCKGATPSPSK